MGRWVAKERKTASGNKTLTSSYFPNIIIMGGGWIELRIIWGKKLNTPQAETKIFLHLKFNMQLQVFGSKRNLNLPLDKAN